MQPPIDLSIDQATHLLILLFVRHICLTRRDHIKTLLFLLQAVTCDAFACVKISTASGHACCRAHSATFVMQSPDIVCIMYLTCLQECLHLISRRVGVVPMHSEVVVTQVLLRTLTGGQLSFCS